MTPGASSSFMDPRIVVTHFHLRPGDTVADFGAGSGHYLKALSSAVSSSGSVYACDIQKSLVEALTKRSQDERLSNVHAVWCDLEAPGGTKFRDGFLDAGLLINTLFQIENKEAALTEIARVIRKGGKLILIDWSESFGGMGPHYTQVLHEEQAKSLLMAHGFVCERDFPSGDHHYGLVFSRA